MIRTLVVLVMLSAVGMAYTQKTVPNVVGLHVLEAKSMIAQAGLELGAVREVDGSKDCPMRWCVVRQTPAAGARVASTATVTLEVSR